MAKFDERKLQQIVNLIPDYLPMGQVSGTVDLRRKLEREHGFDEAHTQRAVGLACEAGMLQFTGAPYRTRVKRIGRVPNLAKHLKAKEEGDPVATKPRKKGFQSLTSLENGLTAGAALPVGRYDSLMKAAEDAKQPNPATNHQEALGPDNGITHYDAEAEREARKPTPKEAVAAVEPTPADVMETIVQAASKPSRDSIILRLGTDLKASREKIQDLEGQLKMVREVSAGHAKEVTDLSEQLKASLSKIATQEMSLRAAKEEVAQLNDLARHKDTEIEALKDQLKQAWEALGKAKPEFDDEEASLLSHLYPGEF